MSRKSKAVVLESAAPSYGVGMYEDANKARMKHQSLMQDFQELQKEVDVMRRKIEERKLRKMMLAAEVRFLRRRYQYFVESKTINSLEKEKLVQPPKLLKLTKHMKASNRKEASQPRLLPPIPEPKPKKKHIGKGVSLYSSSPAMQHPRKLLHDGKEASPQSLGLISDLDHKGRMDNRKKNPTRKTNPVLDLNQKERVHKANDTALRNAIVAFDLNQDNSASGKEVSLPSRAPIFDLNEISTGEEDFHSNVEALKFEEVKKMRGPNEDVQNDLMLSICRNAGEGPSRVGKRKISWQDPVALRV